MLIKIQTLLYLIRSYYMSVGFINNLLIILFYKHFGAEPIWQSARITYRMCRWVWSNRLCRNKWCSSSGCQVLAYEIAACIIQQTIGSFMHGFLFLIICRHGEHLKQTKLNVWECWINTFPFLRGIKFLSIFCCRPNIFSLFYFAIPLLFYIFLSKYISFADKYDRHSHAQVEINTMALDLYESTAEKQISLSPTTEK